MRGKQKTVTTSYEKKLERAVAELHGIQEQLIQSEKMASLGVIAAGVAHEINNPLSFLLSNLESLEIYLKTFRELIDRHEKLVGLIDPSSLSSSARDALRDMQMFRAKRDVGYIIGDYESLLKESLEGVSRIRDITQGLQRFSRPHGDEAEDVDLNDCLMTALRVVSNEMKYKCVLSKEFGVIPKVRCNPGHMLQVFMNILLNAAQSISERGKVWVKTYADPRNVFIEIADTGCGISAEEIKRLFTPFYTTKPVGQGTGLGLSVSYGIIKSLGGSIGVTSEKGRGSTFTVRVPLNGGDP